MRRRIDQHSIRIATALAVMVRLPGALAAETTTAPTVIDLGAGPGLVQITFNLLLVLGAIVILAWLFKRVQGIQQPASGALRVSASLPLGPKERLLLVEVGDEQILIGASGAGLAALHVLSSPLTLPDDEPDSATFKARLGAALHRSSA